MCIKLKVTDELFILDVTLIVFFFFFISYLLSISILYNVNFFEFLDIYIMGKIIIVFNKIKKKILNKL